MDPDLLLLHSDREESEDMFDSVERFSKSSLKDRHDADPVPGTP